jgi:hypothetical protein
LELWQLLKNAIQRLPRPSCSNQFEAVELPPVELNESSVTVQFEQYKPFVPELLVKLSEGTIAEPVPVIKDGSTFAIHGTTKTFWVKIWHKLRAKKY